MTVTLTTRLREELFFNDFAMLFVIVAVAAVRHLERIRISQYRPELSISDILKQQDIRKVLYSTNNLKNVKFRDRQLSERPHGASPVLKHTL